ncbi:hypothetical protein M9H77_10792 [Catharanthus roseus]|uniref:Uncharacterized protein n=1 Tax=Catharanthus roseus TaxID=4058 RepID=A0ACC0BCR0_CATRO|nr:hypothetical protein M9H77_10792 [Catharanthus roseus]
MASFAFPDVWTWIHNLPPIIQWKTESISLCICPSCSSQPQLKLAITKSLQSYSSVTVSILADYNVPISLWISKPFNLNFNNSTETISNLLLNFIEDVLNYCPNKNLSLFKRIPILDSNLNYKEMFNFSFLTLTFIICIYEAPSDLRSGCLNILKNLFSCPQSRQVSKMLMRILGSNVEEQWMRTINLAITNWISEIKSEHHHHSLLLKSPSPLFSYSNPGFGFWKVQLYCPVIAMEVESSSSSHISAADDRLMFSLNYHQLEGVIQLNYKVIVREKWIEVNVNTDNIRYDVISLVNETLMNERGAGITEKHFPSRISLHLTPTMQTNVLSVSVSKSSENPTREIGIEKGIEASIEPPNPFPGLNFSAGETMTMSLKPWKFEQWVHGNSIVLNWFLHDSVDGKEVFSSKPSKIALLQPKSWFKNRYSSAYRPFTREGGIIFAGDEYGDSVCWKVDKMALGKTMEWEIKGWIWLTYWPNKYRSLYSETRRAEFGELLQLTLA